MPSVFRCKMYVAEVLKVMGADGAVEQERVTMRAVYGPEGSENCRWSKWAPDAGFVVCVTHPDGFGRLTKGHEFLVDFTPAGPPQETRG